MISVELGTYTALSARFCVNIYSNPRPSDTAKRRPALGQDIRDSRRLNPVDLLLSTKLVVILETV